MNTAYPLTIYFDASCRLCNSEMQNIKAHDIANQLILIDCSTPDFDDKAVGIDKVTLMNRLHAQDAKGQWLIGVAAFAVIYQTIGLNGLATLWGGRLTRPLMERCYPWIAQHRYIFSLMGLPILFELWGKRAAKQAEQRSRLCREGRCDVDE